jgi:hypothetical protein
VSVSVCVFVLEHGLLSAFFSGLSGQRKTQDGRKTPAGARFSKNRASPVTICIKIMFSDFLNMSAQAQMRAELARFKANKAFAKSPAKQVKARRRSPQRTAQKAVAKQQGSAT